MKAKSLHLMRLCLIRILFLALITVPARSAARAGLFPARSISPVGVLYSSGEVTINGRFSHGERIIWSSDLLQSSDEASARLMLYLIGEVTLDRKTTVRISTNPADSRRRVLIASVIDGSIEVKLSSDAEAHIEAAGSIFAASTGSSFRAGISEGRPFIDSVSGNVEAESQIERRLRTTFESVSPLSAQVGDLKSTQAADRKVKVKKRSKLRFKFQIVIDRLITSRKLLYASVTKSPSSLPEFAQDIAANRKVRFSLSNQIGRFDQEIKTTDQNGMVEVEFTATDVGNTDFIVEVIDIDPSKEISEPWTCSIEVVPPGFPTKRVILGVIGAAVIIVILTHDDHKDSGLIKGPIDAEPKK